MEDLLGVSVSSVYESKFTRIREILKWIILGRIVGYYYTFISLNNAIRMSE